MKSRDGKSQRREKKRRRKKIREKKVRRKKMQVSEKVEKSRFAVFSQWFVAPEGRKVGSLKRRVRSHLARWEMKNCTPLRRQARFEVQMYKTPQLRRALLEVEMSKECTPLWREAHLQVKKLKTPNVRSTFGSWDVEKVHAVVARSTFRSQNVQNTSALEHLWKLRCSKSVRRCGAKHISKSKCTKHYMIAPLLDVQMSFRVAGARDCAPCQKWAKRQGFVNDGRCGTFEDDLERCTIQETCSSEMLGGQGGDFLRDVAFWRMRSSGLGRWFCVTGTALRMTWLHFFVAGAVL